MEVEEAINKLEQTLWSTKSIVSRKLKKTEETLVAPGDLELDSRLELFASINDTAVDLELIIRLYKERVCLLASEEAALANFLRDVSKADKTGSGKSLSTAAKAMAHVAQQRAALRHPVLRLHQEIITFKKRAVSDCATTVAICEKKRDDYKGTLLWMANVSQNLDPDATRQMMKFRKVQRQVKDTKSAYDQMKLVSMQKIDLLAAARSNLVSHSIANYQKVFADFLRISAHSLESAAERLKEPVHFKFTILKELDTLESFAENQEKAENSANQDNLLYDFEFNDESHPVPPPSLNLARKDSEDLIDTSQLLADLTAELANINPPATKPSSSDLVDLGLGDFDIFGKAEPVAPTEAPTDLDMSGLFLPLLLDGAPSEFAQMYDLQSVTNQSGNFKSASVHGENSKSGGGISANGGKLGKAKVGGKKDWSELFAELDPLGRQKGSPGDC